MASKAFGTGALPFMLGASICFTGGMIGYYRSCLLSALIALERHPTLLLLHLDANYPTARWTRGKAEAMLKGERNWVCDGMLVSAWQTAGTALDVSSMSVGREMHGMYDDGRC